ncbi:MAG TPA: hypothetical protein VIO57_04880 [Chloroflexota bacterium]|jgi:hypothetical protein
MAMDSTFEQRASALQRQEEILQRLHQQSSQTNEIVARTHHLIEDVRRDLGGVPLRPLRPDTSQDAEVQANAGHQAREDAARVRLLEWEAADLALATPRVHATPREEFAYLLYDLVLHADALGMTIDRLLYHVQYAQDRYTAGA